jgi:hypothetical protein
MNVSLIFFMISIHHIFPTTTICKNLSFLFLQMNGIREGEMEMEMEMEMGSY